MSRSGADRRPFPASDRRPVSAREVENDNAEAIRPWLEKLNDMLGNADAAAQKDKFRQWCRDVANESYPNIGKVAHAVPHAFFDNHLVKQYKPGTTREAAEATPGTQESGEGKSGQTASVGRRSSIEVDPDLVAAGEEYVVDAHPESHQRGTTAQRFVGRHLRILNYHLEKKGRKTMFIVANFKYDYLLKVIRPPENAKKYFTKCSSVFDNIDYIDIAVINDILKNRGELDLMVLHEEKGIILIQVKSIQLEIQEASKQPTPVEKIHKKLKQVQTQLERDTEILNKVMEYSTDWTADWHDKITRVIAVPNLSKTDLKRFGNFTTIDKVVVLCKDDLMTSEEDSIEVSESESDIKSFRAWWKKLPNNPLRTPKNSPENSCIKEIVGKYVGPLSASLEPKPSPIHNVRQFGDYVKVSGLLFARKMLTSRQTDILERESCGQSHVYISGPPGSGKTILLMLKAHTFLEESQQHHVIVVDMYWGAEGRAIGSYIFDTLRKNRNVKERVHKLKIDLHKNQFVDKVKEIFRRSSKGESGGSDVSENFLFLVDEIYMPRFWEEILKAFKNDFPSSNVWCAGLLSETPPGFQEHKLDIVLRCPPAVQNFLHHVDWDQERKGKYRRDIQWLELSTNGPIPQCVRHQDHGKDLVIDCDQCPRELADILGTLKKTKPKLDRPYSAPLQETTTAAAATSESPPDSELKIVILINSPRKRYKPTKNNTDIEMTREDYDSYMRKVESSTFIKTLKEKNIKVDFQAQLGSRNIVETDGEGKVTATWVYNFQGLEADVVIFLPGDAAAPTLASQAQVREIPAPGVNSPSATEAGQGVPAPKPDAARFPSRTVFSGMDPQRRHGEGAAGGGAHSQSKLLWTRDDVSRFTDWDKTHSMLAGSRSLALLILLVP